MHIHEVIIDGFKSYAQRTVVSGFDPQFNAITGLNGSGKSNILDAICFVLGISNLSQVRVGNLQELVYKQGQAGVTKASVTVVFSNTDPSTSPVGYESNKQITVTRQVVIGGKNKYMINGHTVQQSQVQNLFHSVQLNVNNPHFLIMQGRITKVLNMKPEETLSMIEEAAGTRMFETKKQAAIKTIEKKQLKVDELTKCMNEEITPTLESLRTERQNYMTWQSNNTEVERLERFCAANDFKISEEKLSSSAADKQAIVNEVTALELEEKEKNLEGDDCDKKIKEIQKLRDNQVGSDFEKLKKVEGEIGKELVKINTLANNHKETMATEKETLASLTRQIETASQAVDKKQEEVTSCEEKVALKEAEAVTADKNAMAMREKYQNACAGMADESNAEMLSLPEQVILYEKIVRESVSSMQQGKLRADHMKESVKGLKKTSKEQHAAYNKLVAEADNLRKQIETADQKLGGLKSTETNEASLQKKMTELKAAIAPLKDTVDTLSAQLEGRLSFEYKDPVKGFDRSRVKGLVAKRMGINNVAAATALECAAGGKLYQVIVDNEKTATLFLENKGCMKKRNVFIPLNKISYRTLEPAKLKRAKEIASAKGGNAYHAMELITFDEEVRKAMEYTFGNVIICDKPEVAKAVAFDKNVYSKVYTFDGDCYDPQGALSGGAKGQLGIVLTKVSELSIAQNEFEKLDAELKSVEGKMKQLAVQMAASKDLYSDLDLKRHALQMAEEKMADTPYAQTLEEIKLLESQLEAIDKEAVAYQASHDNANVELKRLKSTQTNAKKAREDAIKDFEENMKKAQKAAAALKTEANNLRNRRDALLAELSALKNDLLALKDQKSIAEGGVKKMVDEASGFDMKLDQKKAEYEDAKRAMDEKQEELNNCSKEIKDLEKHQEKCRKAAQNASLEARKLAHKLKQWEKDVKDAEKHVKDLLKLHPWIEKERAYFGMEGTDYDFKARDTNQANKRLKEIRSEQDRLSKKINKKVMGMIEKAEQEYDELDRKKQVILNDKAKIEAVIEELDVKKSQALKTTWVKVNRDFGSIFSTLLPGTHAKLEAPEGMTVTDGLEVKVSFNGVWKDSLTELSGGQRSLLALSLILALLLFKPAPMYILDEVDAALDLSHTQNIGLMLRTHFSTSQFIVVSLKEGMFNNANVIFRTKFIDGVSCVTRTVTGSGKNAMIMNDAEDDENTAPQKKKGKVTASKGSKGSKAVNVNNVENMIEA